jgi:hypothetical protein
LVSYAGIVTHAIQAHTHIGAALVTRIPSSGLPCQRPLPAALVAMSSRTHGHDGSSFRLGRQRGLQ